MDATQCARIFRPVGLKGSCGALASRWTVHTTLMSYSGGVGRGSEGSQLPRPSLTHSRRHLFGVCAEGALGCDVGIDHELKLDACAQ